MRIRYRQLRLPTFASCFLVVAGGSDCLISHKAKAIYNMCSVSSPLIRNELDKPYPQYNFGVNSAQVHSCLCVHVNTISGI